MEPASALGLSPDRHAQLGNWYTEKPIAMTLQGEGVWRVELVFHASDQFEYKYACYSDKEGRCVGYEQGPNRHMFLPFKLQQDQPVMDQRTNFRKVTMKDVWSSVPSQQPFGQQPRIPMQAYPNMGQNGYNSSQAFHGGFQPQYSMHSSYYQSQPYMHQRSPSSSAMALNNDPNAFAQQMKKEHHSHHGHHGHHHDHHDHQQAQQAGSGEADQELGPRLAKVVGEVSGLKKKLKDAQRDHHDEQRRNKELEETHKREVTELRDKMAQLTQHAETLRKEKEEIRQAALNSGKEAAAAEAAESIQRQLKESEQRHEQAETQWARDRDELHAQLRAARESASKSEALAADIKAELEARDTELAIVAAAVEGFGEGVGDAGVRELVRTRLVPLHDRLSALLKYLETEARKRSTAVYTDLLARCSDLRDSFHLQQRKIQEHIQAALADAQAVLKTRLREFVEAKEKEKEVFVERYFKQFDERKRLANELVDLKGKIRVFGRARPFNQRERDCGHSNVLAFPEANRLLIGMNAEAFMMVNDVDAGVDTEMGQNNIEDVKTYELDHIFGPNTTQEQVFEEVRHLVGSVLDGYNVTVFAYGQTGSGKTFTMDGSRENPGITFRSLALFFGSDDVSRRRSSYPKLQRGHSVLRRKVEVEISMVEIYNEDIRDLLCEPGNKTKLEVRQSPDGGSYVPNLTRLSAASLQEAIAIMDKGRENRKTSATKMNATSSRSHMVFTAYLTVTNPVNSDKTNSKLHLVDLAGSERVSKTGASGEQLKEAMSINKSLSALGDVIASLTSKSDKAHVPYRNSKLTFLLQDSLCGHSRTAMFVNLSPSSDNYWETISTLNFGARAASVELGEVQKNFESGELATLRAQIAQLQSQVVSHKGVVGGVAEELSVARTRVSELEKDVDQRDKQLKLLASKNDDLASEVAKQQDALGKKVERLRQEAKAKDERLRELEEAVKKTKKDVVDVQKGQSAELDSAQKELGTAKRQVQELQKAVKQSEGKAQASEGKMKKLEQRTAKAEEEARGAREALTKAKDKSKQELEAAQQEAEAAKRDAEVTRKELEAARKELELLKREGEGKREPKKRGLVRRISEESVNTPSGGTDFVRRNTMGSTGSGSSKNLESGLANPLSPVYTVGNSRKSVREIRLGL